MISTPKTDRGDRVVDIPQRVLDDLEIYRLAYPPIGAGFIFRTADGKPLDPDNWHHRHLVPMLKQLGFYRRGMGRHSIRHGYVSLLAWLGEDIHYISRQVGHSSVHLTNDIYRHTFAKARIEAMRRLNDATAPT